jgi:hypothetical protein
VSLALVDPHVHDHPQFGFIGVLVGELDTLHRRLLDPDQPLPYPCLPHAVLRIASFQPSTAENLDRERRALLRATPKSPTDRCEEPNFTSSTTSG